MGDDAFLQQARKDAELVKELSEAIKQRLDRETDWTGYRMQGYEFPVNRVVAS